MIKALRAYKKDLTCMAALAALLLGVVLIVTGNKSIFGSTTDWECQHTALPEYFRQLFQDSGNLLPSFAPNLGCGQNIFNFAYYGLLSPYILLSYILPVNMESYIITISICSALASVLLFYAWERSRGAREEKAFFLAAMLTLSAPFIFHSHRHIMFVIYMPFLIGAFYGVDRYIAKKKFGLMVIMSTLIVFTSFYYSPEALLSVFIIAVYTWLKKNPDALGGQAFRFALKTCGLLALAVALSAVLLAPTAYALFSGRTGGGQSSFSPTYLIPQVWTEELMYAPYSLGLSILCLLAVLCGLATRRRHTVFLSAALCPVLLWPVFNYATNGTLYVDGKTYIPFLPVALVAIGGFLSDFSRDTALKRRYFICIALLFASGAASAVLVSQNTQLLLVLAVDAALCAVMLCVSSRLRSVRPLALGTLAFMLAVCITVNMGGDELVSVEDNDRYNCEEYRELCDAAASASEDGDIYRTSVNLGVLYHINRVSSTDMYKTTLYSSAFNRPYNDLFYNIFNNEVAHRNASITNSTYNILFNMFSAQKYMIARKYTGAGYTAVKTAGDYTLYENDNTLPFAYFTDRTLSQKVFDSLPYPANAEALIKYAVTEDGSDTEPVLSARDVSPEYEITDMKNVSYSGNMKDGVTLTADKGGRMTVSLPDYGEKLLMVRFTLDHSQDEWNGDRSITINGIKNKLTAKGGRYHNGNYTFDYALSSDTAIDELNIRFSEGVYKISGFEFCTVDYDSLTAATGAVTAFECDRESTAGDKISGTINAPTDGKLVFSLTYDKGYTVLLDGTKVPYQKADSAFIAIDCPAGSHSVEITYRAPMLNAGICVSCAALGVFAVLMSVSAILRRRKNTKNS